MCGRYALSWRPGHVRSHLVRNHLPVDEAPDDDDDSIRSTYNFAPGYHGLIYRAQTSDRGAGRHAGENEDGGTDDVADGEGQPPAKKVKSSHPPARHSVDGQATGETKYKLQAAKWGLVPFWTKRPPDYGSQMRTINCRDDSLIENRGMWNTMKQRKRCIVVCEGFYEWLKKNNGKEKIPHFVKRPDDQLMCFAGLWDMVQYEGSDDKLYSYTIITTDSNKQLKFLHDRMPVILEPGSEAMMAWLDPNNTGWSKELQAMLKPYQGELDCYPVDQAVGKVGNNSPSFIIPVDSKENKKNIANFFGNQRAKAGNNAETGVKKEKDEDRETTVKIESTEDNAPLPRPKGEADEEMSRHVKLETNEHRDGTARDNGISGMAKREHAEVSVTDLVDSASSPPRKMIKTEHSGPSPVKSSPAKKPPGPRKTRSATTNNTVAKAATKEGNTRITNFFGK